MPEDAGSQPVVISREDAKSQGLTRYFTGEPCKYGHVAERNSSNATCLTCMRNHRRLWNQQNPEKCRLQAQRWERNNPEKRLLRGAKSHASWNGREFSLVLSDVVIPSNCPCCGRKLKRKSGGRGCATPSLDRRDNSKGYTPENVCVICWRCNKLKSDATITELTAILAYMKGSAPDVRLPRTN